MSQGIFITGTDTGVGKTIASCLLIDALVKQGHMVVGMKPIASGAVFVDGELQNEDAIALRKYSNVDVAYSQLNPYCFEPAIAPHIAAQQAQQQIDMDIILQAYTVLSEQAEYVIVEGVGGWSVPMSGNQTIAEIPSRLNLPVILVVGIKLGCINHALLTANAIRANGNNLIGWIANQIDPDMTAYDENLQTLKAMLSCPLIAHIPYFNNEQNDPNRPININLNVLKS
jgi:dethiobiotin synthetase